MLRLTSYSSQNANSANDTYSSHVLKVHSLHHVIINFIHLKFSANLNYVCAPFLNKTCVCSRLRLLHRVWVILTYSANYLKCCCPDWNCTWKCFITLIFVSLYRLLVWLRTDVKNALKDSTPIMTPKLINTHRQSFHDWDHPGSECSGMTWGSTASGYLQKWDLNFFL